MNRNQSFTIGRSAECALVVNNHFISRQHAELFYDTSGRVCIRDLGSSNGTGIGSMARQIHEAALSEMDLVFFSEDFPVSGGVLMKHFHQWHSTGGVARASLTLGDVKVFAPSRIKIGSSPKADVCLPVLGINPVHLLVHYDEGWKARDLAGGAMLNGNLMGNSDVVFASGSVIDLKSESVSLTCSDQKIIIARQRKGVSLEVENVGFTVKDRTSGASRDLLNDISLAVLPGELIALMGPSGSGKTTLLNIMAGVGAPSRGEVKYDGVTITSGDIQATSHAGYVPQDDLLYGELTVAESLYYSTRYRVPDSVSDAQIKHKVSQVCNLLGLDTHLRETFIGSPEKKTLSGGQRKRINLAMELVTDPLILFLDEPTSGLSSRDTRIVVEALRDLATSMSIAVIVTIHQPSMRVYKNFDKVIYLKAGKLVYYGNAYPGGVSYFIENERPDVAGPDGVMEEIELQDTNHAVLKFQKSEPYRKFILHRMVLLEGMNDSTRGLPEARAVESWFRQVWHASQRYAKCRMRDRQALIIQVLQGPFVGFLLGLALSRTLLNTPLFLFVFVAIWFGTNNTSRELVSERTLFRREKRSGADVGAMLLSKLGMNSLVTLAQCILLVWVGSFFVDVSLSLSLAILICWLASFVGIAVGLLISACAKTDVAATVITPLVLIPFILFGGLLAPIDSFDQTASHREKKGAKVLTHLTPSRWGYEAMIHAEKLNTAPSGSLLVEFRKDHRELTKSERRSKIKTCLFVLLVEFVVVFALVWGRVAMKNY